VSGILVSARRCWCGFEPVTSFVSPSQFRIAVTSCFLSGIILEPSDKRLEFFFLIELPWLFLEHIHKVFDEMFVREKVLSWVHL
jgi:hypothetical protein